MPSLSAGMLWVLAIAVTGGFTLTWHLTDDRRETAAYVAMCLVVKDQPRDVVEWVQHHQQLGVGKFYIFDHNSSVPLITELYPQVDTGLVRYQYFR